MAVLTNQAQTLLTGLSDFWQRLFADRDILNALYAATEVEVGQAYLDIVTQVLNQNLDDIPLFNREYWKNITIRLDQVRFDSEFDFPYRYEMPDTAVDFQFLLNRIYSPTVSLERDIDFEVNRGTIGFKKDPFINIERVASRQVDITPTVYRTGADGFVAEAVADPAFPDAPVDPDQKTFFILGVLREGTGATFPETNTIEAPKGAFTAEDIGRSVAHTDPANPTGPLLVREITGVVNATTAVLDPPLATTYTARTYNWEVRDPDYFTEYDEGTVIVITDPTSLGRDFTYVIDTVIDGSTVVFTEAIDLTPSYRVRLKWTHQSASRVPEISLWAPDVFLDRENLYLSFGYLINRYEPSSESYRALIQGIFRYFMLGPALIRTESALNVLSGIPVVREDGEVIEELDTSGTDFDVVITDRDRYAIPSGSFKETLSVGSELRAFDSLTDIFEVTDYIKDPTWYFGETIPAEILPGPDSPRRSIDPNLYASRVGTDKWLVGDPDFYVGADDHGFVVPPRAACDLFPDGANTTRLIPAEKKFFDEDIGKAIEIENVVYQISAVGAAPEPYVELTDGATSPIDFASVINDLTYIGTVTEFGSDIFNVPGHTFSPARDLGRILNVTAAGNIATGKYRVVEILTPTSVRVERFDGSTPSFFTDPGFTVQFGLCWDLQIRPPVRHTAGYLFMRDMLKTHVWNVAYSYTEFPSVPFPRPEEDIRRVLFAGKPAYTYLFVDAASNFSDEVGVGEETVQLQGELGLSPTLMQEVDGQLEVGGGWTVGDYYYYSNPTIAWYDVLREDVLDGSVVEVPNVSEMQKVAFSAVFAGGTDPEMTVQIYAWDGSTFQPTSSIFTLDPDTNNVYVEDVNGRRLAVSVTVSGSPDQAGLDYGLLAEFPQTIFNTSPEVTSTTGNTNDLGKLFTEDFNDPNVFFNPSDVLRELVLKIDGTYTRYRISTIVDQHTVNLVEVESGLDTFFSEGITDIEWYWAPPRRTATNVVVGGPNPDVVKTDPGNYIIAWPVLVTLEN